MFAVGHIGWVVLYGWGSIEDHVPDLSNTQLFSFDDISCSSSERRREEYEFSSYSRTSREGRVGEGWMERVVGKIERGERER